MATVLDVAKGALQELGVLAAGEAATSEDAALALSSLNDLVDQWKAERLMIYTVTRSTWDLDGSTTYTVGSGGDVDIDWPVFIERAGYIDTSGDDDVEYILPMPTEAGWASIPIKSLEAERPSTVYYEATYPLGTLYYYPVPTDTSLDGVMYHAAPVDEFAALTTSVALPPGYRRMLRKNLAVELAPSFNRQPSPLLLQAAMTSKDAVKRANFRPRELQYVGFTGRGRYDIESDQ